MVRNSLKYVNYKQRAEVAKDLKTIYAVATEAEAEFNLELFTEKWDQQYPAISKAWRVHWARIIPLFSYPEEIRKVIQVIWNTLHHSGILGSKEHRLEEFRPHLIGEYHPLFVLLLFVPTERSEYDAAEGDEESSNLSFR
jgi:hypothetical protein